MDKNAILTLIKAHNIVMLIDCYCKFSQHRCFRPSEGLIKLVVRTKIYKGYNFNPCSPNHGGLAQLVERMICTHKVAGSIPAFSTLVITKLHPLHVI